MLFVFCAFDVVCVVVSTENMASVVSRLPSSEERHLLPSDAALRRKSKDRPTCASLLLS